MLSLASQIAAAGNSKPTRTGKRPKTAEGIAKWRASMHATTVARYRKAFEHFARPATTGEIAKHLGYSESHVGRALKSELSDYAEHVDTLPTPNGKGHFVWEWKK